MQSAPQQKFSLMDLWAKVQVLAGRYAIVFRKFWWIPAITTSIGLVIAFWNGIHVAPSYVSSARMMITSQFQIEGTAHVVEQGDFLGTQFALMLSEKVAQRARTRIHSQHPDWIHVNVGMDVSQTPRTNVLTLRATGPEPLYTQAFLDAAIQEYITLKREMRVDQSDTMTATLRNALILLEKETNDDEQEMLLFREKNGFVQEQGNYAGQYLSELERELATLKTNLKLLKTLNLDQNIDRQQGTASFTNASANGQGVSRPMSSTLDPSLTNNNYGPIVEYQREKQSILDLKQKREDALKTMKPANPKVKDIEEEIHAAENRLENYRVQSVDVLKMREQSLNYQIQNHEGLIREWSAKATDLGQKLAEQERIKLKLDHDRSQYDRIITTLNSVDTFKNVAQEPITVVEGASPAVSAKPSLIKSLFSGLATGLVAGLAILFLIDKTNDKIGSTVECKGSFKEYGILGQIPHDDMEGDLSLLVPYDPRHALLEAFRALRSSILFAPVEGTRPKAFMITSASTGEGKTVIAANMAATLAFSGAKVLLIDCNLSNGRLHELFETTPDIGLLNVLQQQVPWNEAVVQTNIDNLFLLPRGEALAYPAEHFFGAFLKEIYPEFDYIIFDSASILDNVDALSFAPIVDGVLFAIRFGQTETGKANRALNFLEARQVNILGLICNDV
ncbi:MAG: AAA family ATPase [Verrucomicrobiota bacterium]